MIVYIQISYLRHLKSIIKEILVVPVACYRLHENFVSPMIKELFIGHFIILSVSFTLKILSTSSDLFLKWHIFHKGCLRDTRPGTSINYVTPKGGGGSSKALLFNFSLI